MSRPLSRSALGRLLAPILLGLGLAAGCSSTPGDCSAHFAGFVTETGSVASGCSTLTADADGGAAAGYALKLEAMSAHVVNLDVSISLGAAPGVGTLSSDTVTTWSALGLGANGCGYGAGPDAVPMGSFTMDVTHVADEGGIQVAHGTLDMTLYVHAPPATDCGPDETEDVKFTF